MKTFTEWLEDVSSGPDIYSARESLKNAMANMRDNPQAWLGQSLSNAHDKVKGNRSAEAIVDAMQNMASRFFQEIRNKSYGIMVRNGAISTPRMPRKGEQDFEEYQNLYLQYYDRLHAIWQGFDKLLNQKQPTSFNNY